jgi:hypothetical protein
VLRPPAPYGLLRRSAARIPRESLSGTAGNCVELCGRSTIAQASTHRPPCARKGHADQLAHFASDPTRWAQQAEMAGRRIPLR